MTELMAMTQRDWPAVREIYAFGIDTGHATFESEPPTWETFDESRLPEHRHVARGADGQLLGWAAVSAVSSRCVYSGVVESSLYVHPRAQGVGVGRLLLRALIGSTEEAGIWTVRSGIFPENEASLRLHESCGFRRVGTQQRLGLMTHGPLRGQWRDVVLVERRSAVVGTSRSTGPTT